MKCAGPKSPIYTERQWEEINAAVRVIRDALLNEEERTLLLDAAERYCSPLPTSAEKARKWTKLTRQIAKGEAMLAECISDAENTPGLLGFKTEPYEKDLYAPAMEALSKLRKNAASEAASHRTAGYVKTFLIIPETEDAPVRMAYLRENPGRKAVYERAILKIWVDNFGGDLDAHWDDIAHKVRGNVVKYFQTVARPVMGDAMPSLTTLPRIVSRERENRSKVKMARPIAPEDGYVEEKHDGIRSLRWGSMI